jgi:hypothetical protein
MLAHETRRDTQADLTAAQWARIAITGTGRYDRHASIHSFERAALTNAVDDGLMPDEVERILSGRRIAEAFPVRWGESPEAYASRAVSEMFVAYLQ